MVHDQLFKKKSNMILMEKRGKKKNVEQYNTLVEQKRSSRVVVAGVQHHDWRKMPSHEIEEQTGSE